MTELAEPPLRGPASPAPSRLTPARALANGRCRCVGYACREMTQQPLTDAQLRELDTAIDTAVSDRDAATLDALLADDFVYTHAGGTSEPKREFIATAAARVDPPRRVLHDLQVEPHRDVAVTRGTIEFLYSDARPNLYLGYVRVYRQLVSGWRAISHRSFYVVERG
jgi:ketosteroid isomerase-like protein